MRRRAQHGSDKMSRAHNRTAAAMIVMMRVVMGTVDTIDRPGMCRSYGISDAELQALIDQAQARRLSA